MNIKYRILLAMAMLTTGVLVIACSDTRVAGEEGGFNLESYHEIEHCTQDSYFTIFNEANGEELLKTARKLYVGNEWIDQDNRLFRIVEVNDKTAKARLIKKSISLSSPEVLSGEVGGHLPVQGDEGNTGEGEFNLGVYHSHGAEAYVPSDGDEYIEEGGGILNVREAFVRGLEAAGVSVNYSDNTHVPHDAGAYARSRRTVEELLKENPAALFDIHRDAVPKEEYLEEVEGAP